MNYLRVQSGPHLLLWPTDGVLEVLTDDIPEDSREHTQWRGRLVRKVSLARLFGANSSQERVRIVYQAGEVSVVYLVEAVLGLAQVAEESLLPLPPLTEPCASWFDRAWPDDGYGALLLRCRLPLTERMDHDQTVDRR